MERATKLFVLGWACAALAAQLWLLRSAWPGLTTAAPVLFVGAAGVTAFDRRAATWVAGPLALSCAGLCAVAICQGTVVFFS